MFLSQGLVIFKNKAQFHRKAVGRKKLSGEKWDTITNKEGKKKTLADKSARGVALRQTKELLGPVD